VSANRRHRTTVRLAVVLFGYPGLTPRRIVSA
jgi:hypothetical protein